MYLVVSHTFPFLDMATTPMHAPLLLHTNFAKFFKTVIMERSFSLASSPCRLFLVKRRRFVSFLLLIYLSSVIIYYFLLFNIAPCFYSLEYLSRIYFLLYIVHCRYLPCSVAKARYPRCTTVVRSFVLWLCQHFWHQ